MKIKLLFFSISIFLLISCEPNKPIRYTVKVTYSNGQEDILIVEAWQERSIRLNSTGCIETGTHVWACGVRNFKILKPY